MKSLFEFIDSEGLAPGANARSIRRWKFDRLQAAVHELRAHACCERAPAASPFSFVANSPLSGAAWPCSSIDCRRTKLDSLARFSALFAEKVLIRDPFGPLTLVGPTDLEDAKQELLDVLRLLYEIRPLAEAGIVGIAYSDFNLCPVHGTHLVENQDELLLKIEKARNALIERYAREVTVTFDREMNTFGYSGPESLLEHGGAARVAISRRRPRLGAQVGADGYPVVVGASKRNEIAILVHSIMIDVLRQNIYSSLYNFNYLTDRPVDWDAITAVNTATVQRRSRALVDGMSHSLPFVTGVKLDVLLKLRRDEGEAFAVYRDALQAALSTVDATDEKHARAVFTDVVQPELNRMALAVRSSRRMVARSIAQDVLIGAGTMAVGLFSGLLSPTVAATVAAVGGLSVIHRTVKQGVAVLAPPVEVRENPFYFLWQVKQSAARRSPWARTTVRS